MTSNTRRTSASLTVVVALLAGASLSSQTRITAPKNSYTPAQDVELGREAAQEVRQQLPMLNDEAADDLADRIGDRLVGEIPSEFRQPAFRYSFDVVNLKEINAFALPGGPMFLHRGMIEAAGTDAEVAGVMAHELAHVVLRHGTAQATKGQKFQIGAIAGQILGAIVGGRKGDVIAQGTQLGLGTYFLKYGREYERQADLLGAQIMASAGYDPREMANMFRTIQKQGGGRGPEWLSSHPDPGNRYEAINREAAMLQIDGRADTADEFQSARSRLARLSPAPTMEQVARARQGDQGQGRTANTGRAVRVQPPSGQWRTHQPGDFLRISVPANWQQVGGGETITYAPEGGYGQAAFTHGIQIGVAQAQGDNLRQATDQLVQSFARSNPQLRRQGGYGRASVGGRQGLTMTLSNVSEVTGANEAVNLSTVQLRDGSVLFILGVAPANEARTYFNTFSRIRQSIEISDARR
jgi:Zn-dependent protease with chaperone function